MKIDVIPKFPISSSFLSCEKDTETILKKLFIESRPYSDTLKRLLVIPNKDCLDDLDNSQYNQKIQEMTLAKLINDQYIITSPRVELKEHPEVKSYIILSFDNFIPNPTNPQFRDCTVYFDIVCNTQYWDLGNYRHRPLKIAGYIDGLLNNCKLSGIGTFQFAGCNFQSINQDLASYTLQYHAIHGSDDWIEE